MPNRWRRYGWGVGRLLLLFAGLVASVVALWPGWMGITERALAQREAGYILLVPLVIGWLVYVRWSRISSVVPRYSAAGAALIGAALAVYFGIGIGWDKPVGRHTGAVLALVGVLMAVLGPRLLARFAAPLLATGFLIPPSAILMRVLGEPLRWLAVKAASGIHNRLGGESFIRGDALVFFSQEHWQHVPLTATCDVLATVTAFWIVAYGFVFGTPLRAGVRGVALLLAPLIGLLTCIIALAAVLLLADDVRSLMLGAYQIWVGWVTLGGAFLALVGVIRLLVWAEVPVRRYQLAQGH